MNGVANTVLVWFKNNSLANGARAPVAQKAAVDTLCVASLVLLVIGVAIISHGAGVHGVSMIRISVASAILGAVIVLMAWAASKRFLGSGYPQAVFLKETQMMLVMLAEGKTPDAILSDLARKHKDALEASRRNSLPDNNNNIAPEDRRNILETKKEFRRAREVFRAAGIRLKEEISD